jgi:hypothetical protein
MTLPFPKPGIKIAKHLIPKGLPHSAMSWLVLRFLLIGGNGFIEQFVVTQTDLAASRRDGVSPRNEACRGPMRTQVPLTHFDYAAKDAAVSAHHTPVDTLVR